jgi:hypothetical protein
MQARSVAYLLAVALACIAAGDAIAQQKLYRWVDDEGIVHYGDHVPPEFARTDRDILNRHGVAVDFEQGEITAEERAEMERLQAEADEAARIKADAARRDRMLLDTYLTVADIEDLRDRRLELLGSQIKVTELYLNNLRKRLVSLQAEASSFKPYSQNADARDIPEFLALDISRTLASINLYEETLAKTRQNQQDLREAFELDIERFREIKGG